MAGVAVFQTFIHLSVTTRKKRKTKSLECSADRQEWLYRMQAAGCEGVEGFSGRKEFKEQGGK